MNDSVEEAAGEAEEAEASRSTRYLETPAVAEAGAEGGV
jgi:hypothetical protein